MTVRELIAALAQMPPDERVVLECPCDQGYTITTAPVSRVEARAPGGFDYMHHGPAVLVVADNVEGDER